jgi:hypothetical protein
MADSLNTHDVNDLAGATYFVVGRGTEGGSESFRLSVAGVTSKQWGELDHVVANSGYSLGTIQVDLGQRGTWPLGAISDTKLKPGETTYVDGVIDQASKYAKEHGLKFPEDTKQLRSDLLSHGDAERHIGKGEHRHVDPNTPLRFIDKDTRDSINAWASSPEGQQWIHKNIDFPQVKAATQTAMDMVDKYGKNISEDHRLETVAILAKTANQMPGALGKFEEVLKNGGDYKAVLDQANDIKHHAGYYDGPKAASIAETYKNAATDPVKAAAMERAQAKVNNANFDPSKADPDINAALSAIHPPKTHGKHTEHPAHPAAHADHPAQPAQTNHPAQPAHADHPAQPAHATHPAQPTHAEPPAQAAHAAQPGHVDHPAHPAHHSQPQHNQHHGEHAPAHHNHHHGHTHHAHPAHHEQPHAQAGHLTPEAASALPQNAGRKETTDHMLAALLSNDPAVMHAGVNAGLNTHASQQNIQAAHQTAAVVQAEQVKQPAQVQPAPQPTQNPAVRMA